MKPEARAKVLEHLRRGLHRSDAARCSGITYECLRLWMRDDVAFLAAVKEAESFSIVALVERVQAAADDPKHWTAAAWLLERRRPEKYGRRDRVKQEISLTKSSDELRARAIELAKALVKGESHAVEEGQLTEGDRGEHRDGGGGGEAA